MRYVILLCFLLCSSPSFAMEWQCEARSGFKRIGTNKSFVDIPTQRIGNLNFRIEGNMLAASNPNSDQIPILAYWQGASDHTRIYSSVSGGDTIIETYLLNGKNSCLNVNCSAFLSVTSSQPNGWLENRIYDCKRVY